MCFFAAANYNETQSIASNQCLSYIFPMCRQRTNHIHKQLCLDSFICPTWREKKFHTHTKENKNYKINALLIVSRQFCYSFNEWVSVCQCFALFGQRDFFADFVMYDGCFLSFSLDNIFDPGMDENGILLYIFSVLVIAWSKLRVYVFFSIL